MYQIRISSPKKLSLVPRPELAPPQLLGADAGPRLPVLQHHAPPHRPQFIPPLAANRTNALRWLYARVVPYFPRTKISAISVGNDLLQASPEFSDLLLPAIRNVHLALADLGIHKIAVSTTFSFINVVTTPFPPSSARFAVDDQRLGSVIRPLLQFLSDTNSSFLINLYPYNLYKLRSEIPISFPLFQDHPFSFRDDMVTGVRYLNLFDMMVDGVITAMAVAGHENIPLVMTETGWPSSSVDPNEFVDANPVYVEMYLNGLLAHVKSGRGTPLRKKGVAQVYIYELIDKQVRQGRNWWILYPNMTKKYKIDYHFWVWRCPSWRQWRTPPEDGDRPTLGHCFAVAW